MLNYQQEHNLSNLATALIFGITNQGTICAWRKKYITGGTQALFQKQGRRSKMPKKSLIPNKPREEWTKDEELAYLRMENDFLKKYMALVQEDDRKKQQQKKDRCCQRTKVKIQCFRFDKTYRFAKKFILLLRNASGSG